MGSDRFPDMAVLSSSLISHLGKAAISLMSGVGTSFPVSKT